MCRRGAVRYLVVVCSVVLASPTASGSGAEEPQALISASPDENGTDRFRIMAEVKLHLRDSAAVEVKDAFPFPPDFIPPGQDGVYLRTPDAGTSLDISNLALIGEADLTPDIKGRVRVHILDLYNRNPTSSDDRIALREAWVQFGHRYDPLKATPRSSFYALLGKAPRFNRQTTRRLESYGLWGTAVGRLEQVQLQLGGSTGKAVYWRVHLANGNPVFFRDPNALAGDNGTPERVPGAVDPIYQSGFPILYDTKAGDVSGRFEGGAGLGVRVLGADEKTGIDVLGWYFSRRLADRARIQGTYYGGEIELLQGAGISLPITSRDKKERGLNAEGKWRGMHVFAQYIRQDIAGLVRDGVEIETAYRLPINGLFALGDSPLFNWIQPAFRYSTIDNKFEAPVQFVAPSVAWDWDKYDIGVRVGVYPGIDVTAEYARNEMHTRAGPKHPDELLVTLRAAF
ncbi:MAG: hypothetical protein AB1714_11805 [Acidobacteriota bacterium]